MCSCSCAPSTDDQLGFYPWHPRTLLMDSLVQALFVHLFSRLWGLSLGELLGHVVITCLTY